MASSLSYLSEFVCTRMGLYFPKERFCDLERGINSACTEFGFKDAESCIQWLVSSKLTKEQIEILASYLTVGETYFFRERKSFEALRKYILPELLCSRQGKNLRIWSAGCSTGEEAYSIAILLSETIPALADWNITLLATDINPRFLQKAIAGIYSERSFRDTEAWVKERYFRKTRKGQFEIIEPLKKMVTFSYHNLAEDAYPSLLNNTNAMDIIFCRNVLMYFSQERIKKVVQNLYLCLVEGGWLIVSPVETSSVLFSQFAVTNFPAVTFYKKDSSKEVLIPKELQQEKRAVQPAFKKERRKIREIKKREPSDGYEGALALYEQGRYAQVIEAAVKLASHDGTKTLALLARAYANHGEIVEAQKWCEKAIASDRLNPCSHYLHAMILQEQGQVEKAVRSLEQALYLDQDFVLAHFVLGNLKRQLGKSRESEKHFNNALMLLRKFRQDEIIPESEGITAGRLSEIIISLRERGNLHE